MSLRLVRGLRRAALQLSLLWLRYERAEMQRAAAAAAAEADLVLPASQRGVALLEARISEVRCELAALDIARGRR